MARISLDQAVNKTIGIAKFPLRKGLVATGVKKPSVAVSCLFRCSSSFLNTFLQKRHPEVGVATGARILYNSVLPNFGFGRKRNVALFANEYGS
jgi:hypothetical protein